MRILFEDTYINDGRVNFPVGSSLIALLTALENCANALETLAKESTKHNELTEKTNSRLTWIEEALTGRTGGPGEPVTPEKQADVDLMRVFDAQEHNQ